MALMVSVTLFAERVSQEDAALVANNFMNVSSSSNVKKALPAKKMVRKATATEDLYYLYENENGEGWVIVAANDAMTPILAYSETGHFRTENMPVNIQKWLGKYNDFTRRLEADGVVATEEAQNEWKALRKGARKATAAAVVGPLIQTTWDQDDPYYNLCPGTGSNKAYTGCVATAMAQVMKYWNWPDQGVGSHSYRPLDVNTPYDEYTGQPNYSSRYTQTLSANFGETTYDWNNMKNSYSGSATTAQKNAVATLMYHCGVATEMMYGNDADGGSGTMTVNYGDWNWGITSTDEGGCAQNALYTFFKYKKPTGYVRAGYSEYGTKYYDSWTDADWTAMIKAELDKQHPIMYGGAGPTQYDGGHSFICDGYDDADYFHFNWGWSGSNDGYYTLSNLRPGSGGAGGGSYNFNYDQDVIIGIEPDREPIEPGEPVYITWSVNGVEGEPVEVEKGKLITLPADPTCACGKVFVGWTALTSINPNTAPSDLFTTNAGKVADADITYYAVFADQESEGTSVNASKTFAFAQIANANNWENGKAYTTVEDAPVTIKALGGGYNGKWYTSGSGSWRMYSGGTVKITVTDGEVTVVTSNPNCNWTIDNGEASFSPSARTDFTQIVVGYTTGAAASYSNYSKSCDCGTESVVNTVIAAPKAVKIVENGQIVIIRDNAKYTIVGQKIQ